MTDFNSLRVGFMNLIFNTQSDILNALFYPHTPQYIYPEYFLSIYILAGVFAHNYIIILKK
jgi:hypothetical protein